VSGRDLRPTPRLARSSASRPWVPRPSRTNRYLRADRNWRDDGTRALKFGAAILAAHHFEDERLQAFTDQYAVFQSEIEDRALREDFSGPMRVQGAYAYQDCD
jgi:hypothetical protein